MINIHLSKIVNMNDPLAVLSAVKDAIKTINKDFDFTNLDIVFADIRNMYAGKYPGYKKCNIGYHDFQHTTDVFLAMARLISGGAHEGLDFSEQEIMLGLFSSLFHDVGYIQADTDNIGTGAKFTKNHVDRGVLFLKCYMKNLKYDELSIKKVTCMLQCTDLAVKIDDIDFPCRRTEIMAKMLGTADLIGQMGDRTYLEKLLFLFYEFNEGINGVYKNEFELLEKTVNFSEFAIKRLKDDLDNTQRFVKTHFKFRWNMDHDPYAFGMEKHLNYLKHVIINHKDDYKKFLQRDGMIDKLNKIYKDK